MLATVFFVVIGLSILVAIASRTRLRTMSIGDYLVGGRSFPAWLLYFLAVGEVYSIGTMIGLPSGIYKGGASYGVWFVGYILLAYPLGYFIAPLIWRAGVRYDAMTIPDVFGRHFRSRTVELVSAGALLLALIPWGQYQFIGMQVVLGALGLPISPFGAIVLAAVIAFGYLLVSGVRSPAFVSVLKDGLMLLGIVVVGVLAAISAGGSTATFDRVEVAPAMTTLSGSPLTFALTTIVFQSVTFYFGFSAAYLFTARSERAIKQSVVWMPMYMLIYPFLFLASFVAIARFPGLGDPNTVFMKLTSELLPPWLVGVVAGGAGLSGILVLAVTALAIGGIVSRNLVPNVRPEHQKRIANLVVAVFLVAAAVLTLVASQIMLTVLNLTYYLLGQLVPAWLAVMFFRRADPVAISVGMVTGVAASVVLYVTTPAQGIGGVNAGLIAVAINLLLTVGISYLRPGPDTRPMARWSPDTDPDRRPDPQPAPREPGVVAET
jgi:SSS family solute:Na+ symporter